MVYLYLVTPYHLASDLGMTGLELGILGSSLISALTSTTALEKASDLSGFHHSHHYNGDHTPTSLCWRVLMDIV